MQSTFRAFVVHNDEDGFRSGVEACRMEQLPEGEVTVRVKYSGVNYKDGLASIPEGKIVRRYPFIPGIDLAGTVECSLHPSFKEGDEVICTGYELGVSHEGGYSEYARVKGDWLVPLPAGLSPKEAMAIGTAGFTAALSVADLIRNGLKPEHGPVLVTGATGGVGSFAVSMLSKLGFEVAAATGKAETQREWLMNIGAQTVIPREEAVPAAKGALSSAKWAAVVDPVGGTRLSGLLKQVKYGGAVALSGLTGGAEFPGAVYPFILRGVKLLGIDSVYCPMDIRREIWGRLAGEWKPVTVLDSGIREISLNELPETFERILKGGAVGRTIVSM
ncbi:acrylyl-CoA reductase family protein [Paenibacillus sp. DMB20]|uniref:acrylyl-CoA reductase family protein n=1 Tax=Paenibacillus sp. DMB20 TaxID=1642570 RepID=UPI000627759F|nr:acryloyl-CoA reductase [Paenibacillus sp. DMB20]KKO53332.1 quinone oxidoreductase [Paenibacillus sp. DMB20]